MGVIERDVHPNGYVGIEYSKSDTVVILGMGDNRLPVLSMDERRWLAARLDRGAGDAEALARAVSASLTHGEQSPLAAALSAYLERHPWSDL